MAKTLTGKVVSTKMDKTVVVLIERKMRHPVYRKVIMRRKKIKAHNDSREIIEGDFVEIRETRPMSKDKRFVVIKKIELKKEPEKNKTI